MLARASLPVARGKPAGRVDVVLDVTDPLVASNAGRWHLRGGRSNSGGRLWLAGGTQQWLAVLGRAGRSRGRRRAARNDHVVDLRHWPFHDRQLHRRSSAPLDDEEIGRASCRERVESSGGAVALGEREETC